MKSSSKPVVLSSASIYEGKIFDVVIDEIREEGTEYQREIVLHPGSVVVVPVFSDGTVGLVRQYRHAAGAYLLEIPAGTMEKTDSPESGAARELEEEVGVVAGRIEKLAEFYVSPGFLSEKMFLYLATDLTEVGQKLEDDELITIERVNVSEAMAMISNGRIADAKSIIGILLAAEKLGIGR